MCFPMKQSTSITSWGTSIDLIDATCYPIFAIPHVKQHSTLVQFLLPRLPGSRCNFSIYLFCTISYIKKSFTLDLHYLCAQADIVAAGTPTFLGHHQAASTRSRNKFGLRCAGVISPHIGTCVGTYVMLLRRANLGIQAIFSFIYFA